ncbi:hypothetical protein D917_02003 [Trichinella nativa]|uniref:Uncharacterized protein n=1 Tax=Trichinella nativa TaxID=6335 RepID=A0A1Y3EJC7_9BILA|nr:hypothetical protein D917_02003 [Trichinella nativa]
MFFVFTQKINLLNILMSSNRKVLDKISAFLLLQRLRKENVLNSTDFYVPLTMLRLLIVGQVSTKDNFWPTNTHNMLA